MNQTSAIVLKPGKEKSLLRRHPWVFSGAVGKVTGTVKAGQFVALLSVDQNFLGWAAFSPGSQIRARVWSFDEDRPVDAALIGEKIHRALKKRESIARRSDALRLLHGEADGLPGVICDRYADWLVVQFNSAGALTLKSTIVQELIAHTGLKKIYERTDSDSLALEGLKVSCGPLTPQAKAALDETSTISIVENQIHYKVDIVEGHKTGFYVDQRENRALVKQLARGSVLNCFSYTGGFSLSALKAGAKRVVSVDSSASALALGLENAKLNGLDVHQSEWIEADVFKQLRACRANGETFDLIILDPPKFAPNASSVERACRAYKDINILGMQLLNPGGDLLTFSCSGAVSTDLFRKVVAGAGADANLNMQVISNLSAGLDHPIDLAFPEGEYLKGLHLRRSE
jgi:23S rRNA (cytosine1962-C5)-methyltransferase